MKRCDWLNLNNLLYVDYHDNEWGVPVFDDNKLFEMLILEGAQAGLSWETVLNKRENYRLAFDYFNPTIIANYDESKELELLQNPGIIRNKLKIKSVIKNARAFLEIQKEFGSFSNYIWGFVGNKTIINNFEKLSDYQNKTEISDKISKDLKKRGMNFVGSTIIYAFMQATGMVNDHGQGCFKCKKTRSLNF
ncbi:MAG: DNA-3-methyladenine glycosylase I [Candidatus Gracilibacteria bacterium]|nr:DNA-3-methyladenine glycosylase I [Candidatus Gracilibacteria bacterium]